MFTLSISTPESVCYLTLGDGDVFSSGVLARLRVDRRSSSRVKTFGLGNREGLGV